MLIGTHGNILFTNASSGALNIAFRQRASLGNSVSPAKNTIIHTIKMPRAKPKKVPNKRFSQSKPIFLKIDDSAIANKLATNKVAKNNTKNAARIRNDSVGISAGIMGSN